DLNPIFEPIGRLALYHHLPLMYGGALLPAKSFAGSDGFLMSHGPDPLDLARRASSYVDRILRGAKPSELPVQYPTKFELVVNLKTAKTIGVMIPETFPAQAERLPRRSASVDRPSTTSPAGRSTRPSGGRRDGARRPARHAPRRPPGGFVFRLRRTRAGN